MFEIKKGGLDLPAVAELLGEHLNNMAANSPPESSHALDLDALKGPDISFWSLWQHQQLVGCVALKQLSASHGEIKSMKTAQAFTRQGVGRQLLQHVIAEAGRRGYQRLSLETGSMAYFEPARCLYTRFGFVSCEPFAEYRDDPNNVFMTLFLS